MAYFSTLEANDLKELMGVKDMRVVHTLLEIVITWGLYPQLLRGVGLPLAQRIKSGYSNRGMERVKPLYTSRSNVFSIAFTAGSSADRFTTKELNMNHLSDILLVLTDIIQSRPNQETYTSVASILISRHLIDIYAGLLQISYAPYSAIEVEVSELQKSKGDDNEKQSDPSPFQVNAPQIQIDREKFMDRFQQLFKRYTSSNEINIYFIAENPLWN
jgi:hypothetical protein